MKIINNLLTVFFSILITILVLEILVRLFGVQGNYTVSQYPKEMFDVSAVTKLNSNFKGEFAKSEVYGDIEINSKGLRDIERSYEKETGIYRILGLGDSHAFGHGLPLKDSYLSLLEMKLQNKLGYHLEVIKAGSPGLGPKDYLSILEQEGVKYNPDLILVSFSVINDVDGQMPIENYPQPEAIKLSTFNSKKDNFIFNFKSYLRRNVHLYSFIVDRLKTIPAIRTWLQNKGIASGLIGSYVIDVLMKDYSVINKGYSKGWLEVRSILKNFKEVHDNIIVVVIPTREQVDSNRLSKALKQLGYNIKDIDIYKPSRIIKEYCKNMDILCIDLLPEFINAQKQGKQLYFDIDPHFNKEGNALASEIIYNKLILSKFFKKYDEPR